MPTPNEHKLKIALVAMLPEKIIQGTDCPDTIFWLASHSGGKRRAGPVNDTELLHICWLVEQMLTGEECLRYADELNRATKCFKHITPVIMCIAPWPQRAQALAKVKGVEV